MADIRKVYQEAVALMRQANDGMERAAFVKDATAVPIPDDAKALYAQARDIFSEIEAKYVEETGLTPVGLGFPFVAVGLVAAGAALLGAGVYGAVKLVDALADRVRGLDGALGNYIEKNAPPELVADIWKDRQQAPSRKAGAFNMGVGLLVLGGLLYYFRYRKPSRARRALA
jgi:hypothetical protein